MLKSILKSIIIILFLSLSSCQFIYKHFCIQAVKRELGLGEKDELPNKYYDYCNCEAKWNNDGYSDEKAYKECKQCLSE
jgi:hypothetical protein